MNINMTSILTKASKESKRLNKSIAKNKPLTKDEQIEAMWEQKLDAEWYTSKKMAEQLEVI